MACLAIDQIFETELGGCVYVQFRLCKVQDIIGYFHGWEHWSNVIDASPLVGGHPGGQISYTLGLVEYPDGSIKQIYPNDIQFIDDIHDELGKINDQYKRTKEK